ncbi:MAG: hypothetical protein EZS28_055520, partial [Streblomastix strix]
KGLHEKEIEDLNRQKLEEEERKRKEKEEQQLKRQRVKEAQEKSQQRMEELKRKREEQKQEEERQLEERKNALMRTAAEAPLDATVERKFEPKKRSKKPKRDDDEYDPRLYVKGQVQVKVVKCTNLLKSDLIGKNDPYVVVSIGEQKFKTPTVRNTLNPEYNEKFVLDYDPAKNDAKRVKIQVWDNDRFRKDDLVGEVDV